MPHTIHHKDGPAGNPVATTINVDQHAEGLEDRWNRLGSTSFYFNGTGTENVVNLSAPAPDLKAVIKELVSDASGDIDLADAEGVDQFVRLDERRDTAVQPMLFFTTPMSFSGSNGLGMKARAPWMA